LQAKPAVDLVERQAEIYLPVIRMGGRGSCRAWLWIGRSLSLPVKTILPLALVELVAEAA